MSSDRYSYSVTIRHWLPILTFCPVNKLPDLIYVSVTFEDEFVELYGVRKVIRAMVSGKRLFMEAIALKVLDAFPSASHVTVALAFNRHFIEMYRPVVPQTKDVSVL